MRQAQLSCAGWSRTRVMSMFYAPLLFSWETSAWHLFPKYQEHSEHFCSPQVSSPQDEAATYQVLLHTEGEWIHEAKWTYSWNQGWARLLLHKDFRRYPDNPAPSFSTSKPQGGIVHFPSTPSQNAKITKPRHELQREAWGRKYQCITHISSNEMSWKRKSIYL